MSTKWAFLAHFGDISYNVFIRRIVEKVYFKTIVYNGRWSLITVVLNYGHHCITSISNMLYSGAVSGDGTRLFRDPFTGDANFVPQFGLPDATAEQLSEAVRICGESYVQVWSLGSNIFFLNLPFFLMRDIK